MEIEVAFAPDGSVRARVPGEQAGVDYDLAAPTLDELFRLLETRCAIARTTGVERHVHGPDGAHVHNRATAR